MKEKAEVLAGRLVVMSKRFQKPQHLAYALVLLGVLGTFKVQGASTLMEKRWLPSGQRLAFEAANSVVIYDANGRRVARIRNAGEPALSPDGSLIAFVKDETISTAEGKIHQTDIWIGPIAGGKATRLTSTPENEYAPAWSPDGKNIAFATRHPNEFGKAYGYLELIDADGANRRSITANDGCTRPAWHPDGKVLCFTRAGSICTVNTDGKNRRRLSDGTDDDFPSFSPDGRFIIFSRGQDEDVITRIGGAARRAPRATDRIYKMSVAQVETSGRRVDLVGGVEGDNDAPRWSPDSQWIVFMSDREARRKDKSQSQNPTIDEDSPTYPYALYIMRTDGVGFKKLSGDTDEKDDEQLPCWQ